MDAAAPPVAQRFTAARGGSYITLSVPPGPQLEDRITRIMGPFSFTKIGAALSGSLTAPQNWGMCGRNLCHDGAG